MSDRHTEIAKIESQIAFYVRLGKIEQALRLEDQKRGLLARVDPDAWQDKPSEAYGDA